MNNHKPGFLPRDTTPLGLEDVFSIIEQSARRNTKAVKMPPYSDLSGMSRLPDLADGWVYVIGHNSILPPQVQRAIIGRDCIMPEPADPSTKRNIRHSICLEGGLEVSSEDTHSRSAVVSVTHSIINNINVQGLLLAKLSLIYGVTSNACTSHGSLLVNPMIMESTRLSSQNLVVATEPSTSALAGSVSIDGGLNIIHDKVLHAQVSATELAAKKTRMLSGKVHAMGVFNPPQSFDEVLNPSTVISQARNEVVSTFDLSAAITTPHLQVGPTAGISDDAPSMN